MMTTSHLHSVVELQGTSNYDMWSTRMKMILIKEKLWTVTDGFKKKPNEVDESEGKKYDDYVKDLEKWKEQNS